MSGVEIGYFVLWVNSRDDPSNGDENPNHRFITHRTSGRNPTKSDNGAGFDMADNCAGYWARLRDDEELGHVDYAGKAAGLNTMRNS